MFSLLLAQLSLMTAHTVIGSLVSLHTLQEALAFWGYPAVVLFLMIESAGIPFPGETMLLFASFTAGLPGSHLSIVGVIIAASLGSIMGDNIGYLVGRYGGRPFVLRFGKYVFLKEHHLDAAERFFVKHGDKTVFFGRFIAVLRAWAAFLAGVNKMPWPRFLAYNAAGGICWATFWGLLAYYAAHFLGHFSQVESFGKALGFLGLGVVVGCIVFFIVRHQLNVRASRRAAQEALAAAASEEPEEAAPVK